MILAQQMNRHDRQWVGKETVTERKNDLPRSQANLGPQVPVEGPSPWPGRQGYLSIIIRKSCELLGHLNTGPQNYLALFLPQ